MVRHRTLIAAALFLFMALGLFGQSKEDDIRRLLVLTGSVDLADQIMVQIIGQYSTMLPEVGEEFWQAFRDQIDANELVERVIPIYDRHLTHDEILGLIDFYSTDLGKRLIEVTPAITQESMMAGQTLGAAWAQEALLLLADEGYIDL